MTTPARTSTPPAIELLSRKTVLFRPDKTLVKCIATKLIEFDVNAGDDSLIRLSFFILGLMTLSLSSSKETRDRPSARSRISKINFWSVAFKTWCFSICSLSRTILHCGSKVFRRSTMQVLRRMRPHASRSAAAPGNLPISEAPVLLLPTAALLGGPTLRRCRGSGQPPRSQSHALHTALNPAARLDQH